jgi:hypothetical protein
MLNCIGFAVGRPYRFMWAYTGEAVQLFEPQYHAQPTVLVDGRLLWRYSGSRLL